LIWQKQCEEQKFEEFFSWIEIIHISIIIHIFAWSQPLVEVYLRSKLCFWSIYRCLWIGRFSVIMETNKCDCVMQGLLISLYRFICFCLNYWICDIFYEISLLLIIILSCNAEVLFVSTNKEVSNERPLGPRRLTNLYENARGFEKKYVQYKWNVTRKNRKRSEIKTNNLIISEEGMEFYTNFQHSIEVSLNKCINKLQKRMELECYQITRPYPIVHHTYSFLLDFLQISII
jgi:hypothetical protein